MPRKRVGKFSASKKYQWKKNRFKLRTDEQNNVCPTSLLTDIDNTDTNPALNSVCFQTENEGIDDHEMYVRHDDGSPL